MEKLICAIRIVMQILVLYKLMYLFLDKMDTGRCRQTDINYARRALQAFTGVLTQKSG